MLLNLDEEQIQIDSSFVEVLKNEYSFQQRTNSLESSLGINPTLWNQFAELGWLGMSLSVQYGGLGLGLLESGLLMARLGRHLVIEPVWSSAMLATHVLQLCAPTQVNLLEKIVTGKACATLVFKGVTSINSPDLSFIAKKTSTGYQLDGNIQTCPGAPSADYLLVLAKLHRNDAEHPALFMVRPETQGVKLKSFLMLDGSRAASVCLHQVQLTSENLLSDQPDLRLKIDQTIAKAMLLLCWEAMGSMTAAFEQTCAYVNTRSQFGQKLNEFQVVQHRLAEMAVLCREARAICELGVTQASDQTKNLVDIAIRVKAKVSRCAQIVAKDCVQLHGAMGVTEELSIASHFRKLLWFQTIWGLADELDQKAGASRLLSGEAFQSAVLPVMPAVTAVMP